MMLQPVWSRERIPLFLAASLSATLCLLCGLCRGIDVVAIDGKSYSEVDLTGYTKAEMQEAFLAELGRLGDATCDGLLAAWDMPVEEPSSKGGAQDAVARTARRKQAAVRLFEGRYSDFLLGATYNAILGRAFERLAECHGLVAGEYIDMNALDEARLRHARCLQFVFDRREQAGADPEAVHEQARAEYGLAVSSAQFRELWGTGTALPSRKWPTQCALKSQPFRTAIVKSVGLAYLVQPACTAGGYYHAQGALAWEAMRAGTQYVTISGFAGAPAALEDVFGTGDHAVVRFKTLCAAAGMAVGESYKPIQLPDFQRALLDGPIPAFGVFALADDGAWRALLRPPPVQQGLPVPTDEPFVADLAMRMAVRPYLPTVIAFRAHSCRDPESVLSFASSMRDPLYSAAPGMGPREKPLLKPYPDAPFREYAEGRAWSQTWFARLAASVFRADAAQQNALLDELVAYAGSRTTTAGRRLAAKTLETAAAHGGLDAAIKERAERELAALRAAPPAAP